MGRWYLIFIKNQPQISVPSLAGLVALRDLNLAHNKIQYLQNKTHGLFEDCLSIRKIDLSHNKVAFVTRKMFPESKWIPYKLQWVDLSHNEMPVLTKELLIGTKHLRHLNVSANMLNNVRDGVISNLTGLEVLDISHNFLTDKVGPTTAAPRYDFCFLYRYLQ